MTALQSRIAAAHDDPTLRADLIAFLDANAKDGKRVRISTPDYRPACSMVGCGADRDLPNQRYCKDCRRAYAEKYRENRPNTTIVRVLFHTEAFRAGLELLRDGL